MEPFFKIHKRKGGKIEKREDVNPLPAISTPMSNPARRSIHPPIMEQMSPSRSRFSKLNRSEDNSILKLVEERNKKSQFDISKSRIILQAAKQNSKGFQNMVMRKSTGLLSVNAQSRKELGTATTKYSDTSLSSLATGKKIIKARSVEPRPRPRLNPNDENESKGGIQRGSILNTSEDLSHIGSSLMLKLPGIKRKSKEHDEMFFLNCIQLRDKVRGDLFGHLNNPSREAVLTISQRLYFSDHKLEISSPKLEAFAKLLFNGLLTASCISPTSISMRANELNITNINKGIVSLISRTKEDFITRTNLYSRIS